MAAAPGTIHFSSISDYPLPRGCDLYWVVTLDDEKCGPARKLRWVKSLVDEEGANVNTKYFQGETVLHVTRSLDILIALLDRGADPNSRKDNGWTPLMTHAISNRAPLVTRLLEDPRVRAAVNAQNCDGDTALHFACYKGDAIVHRLIEAGAYAPTTNKYGNTPLAWLRKYRLPRPAAYARLEQALVDAGKISLLIKAYKLQGLVVSSPTTMPSCLQGRVTRGEPLPGVVLLPAAVGQTEEEDEEARKFHSMVAHLLGTPPDAFRAVLGFLKRS